MQSLRRKLWTIGGLAGPMLVVVAVLGSTAATASGSGPAYVQVSHWDASLQSASVARLSVETGGAIPRRADNFIGSHAVVGLAWADLDTGRVVVATIHPVLGRDSNQNPDSWHAHTARLTGGASSPNDFCIASIESTPTAGIAINGSAMTIMIQAGHLPVAVSAFDAAVGFTIEPDSGCGSGLAVRLVA